MPLFGVEGNCILDLSGRVSKLYEKKAFDLEGLTDLDIEEVLEEQSACLRKLNCFKAYLSNRRGMVNTYEDAELPLKPWDFEEITNDFEAAGLIVYQNYFIYHEHFYRFYNLKGIPCDISPALFQSILDESSFGLFKVQKFDVASSKNLLEKKRRILFSKLLNPFKDPKSEEDYEELEELIGLIDQEDTSLFKLQASFLVKGICLEDLLSQGEELKKRAKNRGIDLIASLESPKKIIQEYFPGTKLNLSPSRSLSVTLQSLTNLLLCTHDIVHESGIVFGAGAGTDATGAIDDKTITFDPFDIHSQNHNMVISGPSGRGKSVLANKLIFELFKEGKSVVIIDKGASFKKTCLYFEGIEVSSMVALENLSSNLNQSFIYLDINDFSSKQRGEVIEKIFALFKDLSGEKVLVIDECWEFLRGHEDFLEESFRTFRKMRASALAISQSLEDFEQSLLGRVILDNSAHKFLFKQTLRESKYLSKLQIKLLSKCQGIKGEYSEVLYLSDQKTKKLRYTQTELESALFNTEKEENHRFFNFYNQNKDFYKFDEIMARYIS